MSEISGNKGIRPKSLCLNGCLRKYVDVASDCLGYIGSDVKFAKVSEEIARARQALPLKIAVALIDLQKHCPVWEVDIKQYPKFTDTHVQPKYLRGDSRIFYSLCLGEKLPVFLLLDDNSPSLGPSLYICIDMEKFKKTMGVEIE
ncbi:hypothetical protein KKC45_03205 [Patescibacteria group bacterium]|nr:hypothetical protein [Patescibacteria group bacterium]